MKEKPSIGFIGVGAMGGRMARNLLKAGYVLTAYDPDENNMSACTTRGAHAAANEDEVVRGSDVVFTSLPTSEVFVRVAEASLLPHAREGQIFIDVGTVMPVEVERLAPLFADKGAALLDVPVSGGTGGAERGDQRMFAGGDERAFDQVKPILHVLGDPAYVVYCGASGRGQVVKFVNQMIMGLSAGVCLESIALGVRAGVDPALISSALGGEEDWRALIGRYATMVARGDGEGIGVKHGQLQYFMDEAARLGLELPLSRALFDFCKDGELRIREANRASPSFWHELMR